MDIIIAAGLAILGWLMAAFINYAADVLPETRRFSAITCAKCGQQATWIHYIFLRPCARCGQRRTVRAWAVSLLLTVMVVGWWFYPTPTVSFWEGLALLLYFGVVIVIDMEYRLILHPVSLVGAVVAGGIGLLRHGPVSTLLGGLAGFGIMLAFYGFGYLFAKVIARMLHKTSDEEALGFGDVALSTVLGLLMGWPGILGNLFLAILLGGAGSLIVITYMLLTRRYQAMTAIPYGPFLIIASVILLIRPFGILWI